MIIPGGDFHYAGRADSSDISEKSRVDTDLCQIVWW
jgi:hypothetical protein